MRRSAFCTIAFVIGFWLVSAPGGRGPSIEQMFVARTQAATEADAYCLMPGTDDNQEPRLAVPTNSDPVGGDIAPVRMVVDPYPSFNGVAVDTTRNDSLLRMSDTNRKSLLERGPHGGQHHVEGRPPSTRQQIMGPDTGVGFVAGVAMDPVHRELFTVNNDVEDRLVTFEYDAHGNVKPKRLFSVPHQSWGIALRPGAT